MRLSHLFVRCLDQTYTTVGNAADFATDRQGSTLYIYFECSDGTADWLHNLDFPAKPYRRMGQTVWYAHRGFLKVWRSVEPRIAAAIADPAVRRITTVGYSHGAALAVFCHEYVWYHRPDLRERIEGYGFGCPRVLWGFPSEEVRARWASFTVIRNMDDLVTHVPPCLLGYRHVGRLWEIGEKGTYSPTEAHRPEHILHELWRAEKREFRQNSVPNDGICLNTLDKVPDLYYNDDTKHHAERK